MDDAKNQLEAKGYDCQNDYFVEELEKINTWGDQVDLKEAMVAWARIKPLTVPAFKTVFEAASFVNDILIEGDDMKVRSLMYYMSPSDAFKAPERKVFTRYGKKRFRFDLNVYIVK